MQWLRLVVVAIGCALLLPAEAGSLDQLRSFLTQTTSARGEFVQRVLARSGGNQPVSSGRFIFQRPGKFRWSYDKPGMFRSNRFRCTCLPSTMFLSL